MVAQPRATLTIMEDNMPLVQTWVNSLRKVNVFIGVTDENDAREESHIGNIALANIMENGAPSENIPPRPFMKPAIASIKNEIRGRLQIAATYLYQKKNDRARQVLNGIGIKGVAAMRRMMESNIPPELELNTLKKRKKRGIARASTLIKTKQLWRALSYKVKGV